MNETFWDMILWKLGLVRRKEYEHVCGQYAEAVDRYLKTLDQLKRFEDEHKAIQSKIRRN